MRNYMLILVMALTLVACRDDGNPAPDATPLTPSVTGDDIVIQNCYLTRDAAEAWALESGGIYPLSATLENQAGNRLIDFLPGGHRLTNPYTGVPTEPAFTTAGAAGETGYRGNTYGTGVVIGYSIEGADENAEVFIKINK